MDKEDNLKEEKESILKKIFLGILSISLLLLTLSYFLAGNFLFPLLASLSESKIVENKTIQLNNFSIIFTKNTYQELQDYYHKDVSVEMAVCLKGIPKKNYIINEIYQPNMLEQSFDHVSFKPCSSDTIILLHSHPFRHCIASEQDLKTLNNAKQNNPNTLMVIMCESNRFSVYE